MKTLILVALVVSVMLILTVGTAFAFDNGAEKNEAWERGGSSAAEAGGASGGAAIILVDESLPYLRVGAE